MFERFRRKQKADDDDRLTSPSVKGEACEEWSQLDHEGDRPQVQAKSRVEQTYEDAIRTFEKCSQGMTPEQRKARLEGNFDILQNGFCGTEEAKSRVEGDRFVETLDVGGPPIVFGADMRKSPMNSEITDLLNDVFGSEQVEFRGHGEYVSVWVHGKFSANIALTDEQVRELLDSAQEDSEGIAYEIEGLKDSLDEKES